MESLVFIKKIAGMPSGPAAEFFFSLSIALAISTSLNSMSIRSPSSMSFNSSSVILFGLLLSLNCELYCSIRILQISLVSYIYSSSILNGPIFESLYL